MDIVACKESVKKFVKGMLLMNREIRGDCAVLGRNEAVGHAMTFWTSATSQLSPLTVSFLAFTMVFPFTYPPSVGVWARGDAPCPSILSLSFSVSHTGLHRIEGNELEFCSLSERLYSTV
jgi:hypothetical protein